MEIKEYIAIVRKWWWLVVASTLVATAASFFALQRTPRIYEATTTVIIGQSIDNPNPTYADLSISQQLAQTYREMVLRQPILSGAAEALGLSYTPSPANVSAQLVAGTQLMEIRVRDTDPERARALADAVAQELIKQTPEFKEGQVRQEFIQERLTNIEQSIKETEQEIVDEQKKLEAANSARAIQQYQSNIAAMEQKLSTYQSDYAAYLQTVENRTNYISVFQLAATPSRPISPRVPETLLLAAAIGLVLALGGAFLIEFLDDTIKTPEEVGRLTALPVLGRIGRVPGLEANGTLIPIEEPRSLVAEAYRALRTNIQVSSVDDPVRTLMVSSAAEFDGKSTVLANLAVVMAQAGQSVILVDADLRRSTLHKKFRLPNKEGLTTVLLQDQPSANGYLHETGVPNLRVLTSGPLPPNPSELLSSRKMQQLIEHLRQEADIVLFDTPPALPVTDAAVLATRVDGVLFVISAEQTRKAAVRQAVESLKQVKARFLGATLNRMAPQYLHDYGYYQYGGSDEAPRRWFSRR